MVKEETKAQKKTKTKKEEEKQSSPLSEKLIAPILFIVSVLLSYLILKFNK